MDQRVPLWTVAPRSQPTPRAPHHYERWHQKRQTAVGVGYLSILDLSWDERSVLLASEDDARLRLLDFPSLAPRSDRAVPGFVHFERGDFAFWPLDAETPRVLFAGVAGVDLVDPASDHVTSLSSEPADTLRWSDDHRVLGAARAAIPQQVSRLVFYGTGVARTLEPLLRLDFAERVDGWDLDASRRHLAVTYYPSNQVEVLDLASRSVSWVSPGPEYAGSVDFSSDGRRLAVGGSSVVVFDAATGRRIAENHQLGNNIHSVRFSPSGDALAVSAYEGKVRLFDGAAPGPTLPLKKVLHHAGTANVYALVWTRDGSALLSSSGDKTLRLWGE